MPQIFDMGQIALLSLRRKACCTKTLNAPLLSPVHATCLPVSFCSSSSQWCIFGRL